METTYREVPPPAEQLARLTPAAAGIGTASLLADVGHEIPTALLPSFLTATLGAPAAALGLIEGVADGLAGTARLAGGALADDPTRRRATAGVVGFERGGGVEVRQQPRLPLSASLVEYLAHLAADPDGRRGEPWGVDGTDDLAALTHWGWLPDLRPFERVFGEAGTRSWEALSQRADLFGEPAPVRAGRPVSSLRAGATSYAPKHSSRDTRSSWRVA